MLDRDHQGLSLTSSGRAQGAFLFTNFNINAESNGRGFVYRGERMTSNNFEAVALNENGSQLIVGPVLPPELERHIFELAASQFPDTAPALALVARRVQHWVEPLIYKKLGGMGTAFRPPIYELISRKMVKQPQFDKATANARHVLLIRVQSSLAVEILQGCRHVSHLFLSFEDMESEDQERLLTLIHDLAVERLFCDALKLTSPLCVTEAEFDHTYLVNLTHLNISSLPLRSRNWSKWKNLALLPRLTHLALQASTLDLAEQILKECKKIRLLILFYCFEFEHDGEYYSAFRTPDEGIMCDKRIVQMPDMNTMDWIDDWKKGEPDFWGLGEQLQRREA